MNIELFEGQTCLVHVKLTEEWEVYGGTPKGEFRAERESSDSVLVTVPAMEAEFTPLVPYELFARRILDGREWLVLSGQLHVRRRYSDAGGGISPIEYFVEPQLVEDGISSSPQIIVGIPGPQGPKGEKGAPGEGGMTEKERATLAGAAQRGADNTFTAANTFTGSVDMSTAQVTPPEGWNVADLTPEAIQSVAPIAWGKDRDNEVPSGFGTSFALGGEAKEFGAGVAFGWRAKTNSLYATALGIMANTTGMRSIAIAGGTANNFKECGIVIGSDFTENTSSGSITHYSRNYGFGSITIGAGANTLNNGTTESSNSVTIGCKAENKGADSVVIGASVTNVGAGGVAIGSRAQTGSTSVAIGTDTEAAYNGAIAIGYKAIGHSILSLALGNGATTLNGGTISIGGNARAAYDFSIALGTNAKSENYRTIAIGANAKVNDKGAVAFRSTAEDGTYTQLYFSGANTPLANTYHGGAPMLGYVTKDAAGNIVAAGTRSLIDLLTDNSTFAPASLDENGEWVMPKVFHPSDLDMPVEEPSEVEEYTPLPVYPIVEPDDIMGDNGTLVQEDTENTSPETNS